MEAEVGQSGGDPFALGDDGRNSREGVVGVPQCRARGSLRDHREVIRQTDQQQGVDHRRVGGQVTEPPSGERERLAHGSADNNRGRELLDERHSARCRGELRVGLVDDDDAGCRRRDCPHLVQRYRATRRIVRRRQEHHVGPQFLDRAQGHVEVEREVGAALGLDPGGVDTRGDDRMHRVRGHESECRSSRSAEGLQQLLQHFIGSVCCPQVLDTEPDAGPGGEVCGQIRTQGDGIAIGIAVQLTCRCTH